MDKELDIIRATYRYLCCESEQICRLCLSSTKKFQVSLDDTVHLKNHYVDEIVTYLDIFFSLHITLENDLPQVLCRECASIVTQTYLCNKLCQFSSMKWKEMLEKFDNSLKEAETVSPIVKSLYLVVNKTDNVIYTSRKTNSNFTKEAALAKIKGIVKCRSYYKTHIKHKNKYHTTKGSNYECIMCDVQFDSHLSYAKHMRTHGDMYGCPHCSKAFPSQKQVKDHVERVHKPKKIKCPKCAKMFSTKKMLKFHDQQHHHAAICKYCFIQFPSKYILRAHLTKHENNQCPRCNKSYGNKQTYKYHIKICGAQDKQSSYFCDMCGKGYVRKNGLRTHIKVDHGFGKILSCNWCGKRYDAISRLNSHIVKHTKERNFSCDVCGGKFVTQAALIYHKRLHTGEKPFPCDMCSESFLSASRRMEHKRRKHFKPSKECPICNVKFVMGHQLKRHIQRHCNPQSKLYVPDVIIPEDLNIKADSEFIRIN